MTVKVSESHLPVQRILDGKVSIPYFLAMAEPRRGSPYHHGDLKRALVDTSIELLAEGGLDALNVAEAGRRLGVSSAAPYKHFRDRKALLRAVAQEGNRRLNAALTHATTGECARDVAFARMGVAYVTWAAEHPALFLLTLDPSLTEYAAGADDEVRPPPGFEHMAVFWSALAERLRSKEPLTSDEPLVQELAGRALAHGLASLFVSGVFASLDIDRSQAARLAAAVMGLPAEPPLPSRTKAPRRRRA
jgi:AcrR family transcriptional regulator